MGKEEVPVLVIIQSKAFKIFHGSTAFNIYRSSFRFLFRKYPGNPGLSKLKLGLKTKKTLSPLDQSII